MNYIEWLSLWEEILQWIDNIRRRPNLPAKALVYIHKLYDLLYQLKDAIEAGNLKVARQLKLIIEINMVILWQVVMES